MIDLSCCRSTIARRVADYNGGRWRAQAISTIIMWDGTRIESSGRPDGSSSHFPKVTNNETTWQRVDKAVDRSGRGATISLGGRYEAIEESELRQFLAEQIKKTRSQPTAVARPGTPPMALRRSTWRRTDPIR